MIINRSRSCSAADLAGFAGSVAAAQLQTERQILDYLATLLQQPAQADRVFEQRYRDVVQAAFDRLEVFGIRRMDQTTGRQSLTIAYITLEIDRQDDKVVRVAHATPDDELLLSQLLQDEPMDLAASDAALSSQPSPVDHVLPTMRQLVVRGDAGSGKTTLLQWIAVRAARQDFPPMFGAWNNTVPFLIRLRERVGKGFPPPEELPGPVAKNIMGVMPSGWVHRVLDSGHAVVLVDGLDDMNRLER